MAARQQTHFIVPNLYGKPKCRRGSNLNLCMTLGLAKKMPLAVHFWWICRQTIFLDWLRFFKITFFLPKRTAKDQLNRPSIKTELGLVGTNVRISEESSLQSISSNSFLWKRKNWSIVIRPWSWRGNLTASARGWLREANTERWHFIFPYEFSICFHNRNVKESEI